MSFRERFRRVQESLGVAATGIPNDETKHAFARLWDEALAEYRRGQSGSSSVENGEPGRVRMLVTSDTFPIVGHSYAPAAIGDYLRHVRFTPAFAPNLIVIHHCAEPSLAQRPVGFTDQHMLNMRDGYIRERGFKSGPHFFVDDHGIRPFTPLWQRGVHAHSYNATGIGIEMLGDYDTESPWTGRGATVLAHTRTLVRALEKLLELPANHSAIRFHRDDPKTTKTCPGRLIHKPAFLQFLDRAA